jgi:hypothetical protein
MQNLQARPDARSEPIGDAPLGISKPLRDFMQTESGSAALLVLAAVVALLWANSPWSDAYESLRATVITVDIGSRSLSMDLVHSSAATDLPQGASFAGTHLRG